MTKTRLPILPFAVVVLMIAALIGAGQLRDRATEVKGLVSSDAKRENVASDSFQVLDKKEDQKRQKTYSEKLEHIRKVFPKIFHEDLLGTVEAAYPNDLRLAWIKDYRGVIGTEPCDLVSKVERETKLVSISENQNKLLMFAEQGFLLWMLESKIAPNPEQLRNYVATELGQVTSAIRAARKRGHNACKNLNLTVRAVPIALGYSQQEYIEITSSFLENESAISLGDYLGGIPMFFIGLHELGHIWNGDFEQGGLEPGDEARADAFAIEMLRRNGIPPIVAFSALSVLAETNQSNHVGFDSPACRLKRLAESGLLLDNRHIVRELEPYQARLSVMRQEVLDAYRDACPP